MEKKHRKRKQINVPVTARFYADVQRYVAGRNSDICKTVRAALKALIEADRDQKAGGAAS